MSFATQIGGKFSTGNPALFSLKRSLEAAGTIVRYPEGYEIVASKNDIDLTFDPATTGRTLIQTELLYLKAIKDSSFHTVFNFYRGIEGYLGVSATMEVLYAMVFNVPVLMLYAPSLASHVRPDIAQLLLSRQKNFTLSRLDTMSRNELAIFLGEFTSSPRPDYQLSLLEEVVIMRYVADVLETYR